MDDVAPWDAGAVRNGATGRSPIVAGSARPALVAITGVTKTYRMGDFDVHALRGVSLDIGEGEFAAIMGASGSGKSTLMNILGCLDVPTAGKYLLAGRDVGQLSDNELADVRNLQIGFVFQSFHLLPRATALENVELPLIYRGLAARERREQAKLALRQVGLEDRMKHRPAELSGGQKQRVAIARAIVANPRILILDEATSSLDSESEALIQDGLNALMKGRTTFVIAHRLSTIRNADQILVLENGEITERGTHAELMVLGGRYRKLYEKQYGVMINRFVNEGEELKDLAAKA